jgi:hypothetical protein
MKGRYRERKRKMKNEGDGNSDSKALWSKDCRVKLGDVFDSIK